MEPIVLYPHNPEWLLKFDNEKEALQIKLAGSVLKIQHVGSTAVAGLMAKPIIDIAIESYIYPPTINIQVRLAALGYECRGESGIEGRIWFTKGRPREINLYYRPIGSDIVKKQISFRECLKQNAAIRAEYEILKLNNCQGRDFDDAAYAESKSQLIETALSVYKGITINTQC